MSSRSRSMWQIGSSPQSSTCGAAGLAGSAAGRRGGRGREGAGVGACGSRWPRSARSSAPPLYVWLGLRLHGEPEPDGGADALPAVRADVPTVRLDDALGDVQAQPGAATAHLRLPEALEEMRQ